MNNFVFCVLFTRKLKKHLPLRERFASTIHFDLNFLIPHLLFFQINFMVRNIFVAGNKLYFLLFKTKICFIYYHLNGFRKVFNRLSWLFLLNFWVNLKLICYRFIYISLFVNVTALLFFFYFCKYMWWKLLIIFFIILL